MNIVILWGGGAKLLRRTTPPRGVWGYALPGFFLEFRCFEIGIWCHLGVLRDIYGHMSHQVLFLEFYNY